MKKILCMLLICAMAVSLFGCGSSSGTTASPSGESAATEGSTSGSNSAADKNENQMLYVSLATELQTLSILGQQNIVTNEVLTNIYDGLLKLDTDANIVPNVAESYEWNEEECKYTFHLKQGVKFHDGSELKASDVVFSVNLILNEYSAYLANVVAQVDHVEAVDDYTVDIYLTSPSSTFLYNCCIYIKLYAESAWESTNHYTEGIVSCGPYKLVSYDPTRGVELEAFEDYHGDPKPAIKHVFFSIVPDANTQVLALQSGELNISRDFPASAISTINSDDNLDIYSHKCGMVYFLQFNLRDNAMPELKNTKVRQAINYALDKDFMVTVAEEGIGEVANSIANKNMFGYDDEVVYYEHDVEKAKALLTEAGYPDGFDLGTLYCRSGKDESVAQIAQSNLAEAGITCTVSMLENNAFIDSLMTGNFNVAATHLNLNTDASHVFEVTTVNGSVPYSGINDPYIEAQHTAAELEMDNDARWQILNDTLDYLSDEAYFAPCYYPMKSYAHTAGLTFSGYDPFVGMQLRFLSWE